MTRKQRHISWRPMLPAVGERSRRRLCGIYSKRQMEDLMLYEKTRSDRMGSTLSLVVFGVGTLARRETRAFIEEILSIARTTDHVGWFGERSVAVLLPYTNQDGARVFCDHLSEAAEPTCVSVELYTYPDVWFKNAFDSASAHNGNGSVNGNGNGNHNGNGSGGSNGDGTGDGQNTKVARGFRHVVFEQKTPLWKRSLDIFGAGLGIVALSPVFLLVGVFIKLVSPGPVIYKQQRVGIGRRGFTFFKFRTMHVNNDESYHAQHARDFITADSTMDKLDEKDPRIIFGGRVLRKACIDELPQLVNILRGDMSLVGPRPCIPYEAEEYHRWHTGRFSVLPGLTGLWQISGKNKLTFQQMIRLDIIYERRMSLRFDLWIILMTLPAIFGMVLESVVKRVEGYAHLSHHIERIELPSQPPNGPDGCSDAERGQQLLHRVPHEVGG